MHTGSRAAAALLLTALLAGCASPGGQGPSADRDAWVTPGAVVLVDGSFDWHGAGLSGSPNPPGAYGMASQAVAHPCVWDGPDGREPYFNNLRLPVRANPYPVWSGNLSVTLGWTEADWVGTHLRLAYREPGSEAWLESQPTARGATLAIPFEHEPGANATEGEWDLWACLPTDTFSPEAPFFGSVTAHAAFQADAMPASALEPKPASASGRTARQ